MKGKASEDLNRVEPYGDSRTARLEILEKHHARVARDNLGVRTLDHALGQGFPLRTARARLGEPRA